MYSAYQFPLWWLWEYTCMYFISIIKSEAWPLCHYLGFGHETMVCISIFLMTKALQNFTLLLRFLAIDTVYGRYLPHKNYITLSILLNGWRTDTPPEVSFIICYASLNKVHSKANNRQGTMLHWYLVFIFIFVFVFANKQGKKGC